MTPTELDGLPPMSAVVTGVGTVYQKGYSRWYLPGREGSVESETLAQFGKLQVVWEGEA